MTTLTSTGTYFNVRGRVTQYLPQSSETMAAHFMHKLCHETDPSFDGYATEKGPLSSNPLVCGCE